MIVGTAGHIDHGKTALVKALTGVDADRLAEEKARGITIDLGFAYVDLGLPDATAEREEPDAPEDAAYREEREASRLRDQPILTGTANGTDFTGTGTGTGTESDREGGARSKRSVIGTKPDGNTRNGNGSSGGRSASASVNTAASVKAAHGEVSSTGPADARARHWPIPSGRITGFVDVPGHERLIRTMLAGAGGIDFALLVIAADDGVMPQTREHLAILNLLGVAGGVVALTKADLADETRRGEVTAQIRAALAGTALTAAPVIPVSALTGEGIEALRVTLARAEAAMPTRETSGPFRLAVDRSFSLAGTGTVVTGTLLSGRVAVGDSAVVSPSGLPVRVRGLHAQNRPSDHGVAGQRCALNLSGDGIGKADIARGDVIVSPGLHAPSDRIDVVLEVLASESKAISTWFPVHLHSQSVEVPARVVPLAGDLLPGEAGFAQIVLERPIATAVGDRFILRDTSASRTLGGGHIVDLRAPARKRGTPERLAWLNAARSTHPAAALMQLVALTPVQLPTFLRDRALDPAEGARLIAQAHAETIGDWALSAAHASSLREQLVTVLATFHQNNPDLAGIGREKLRLILTPRLAKEPFLAFLHRESATKQVVLDGAFVRLPGHSVQLAAADERLWQRMQPQLLGEWRFRPPRVRDFASELGIDEREVRRVLKLTQKLGLTDQVAHDHFFAREVVREMVAFVHELAAGSDDGWFGAPAFRDRMDNGRKVAIQILDFFDSLGLTLRRGDLRRLNPHRRDLFDH